MEATLTQRLRDVSGDPELTVRSVRALAGGACSEMARVDVDGQLYVLRGDAPGHLPSSLGRKAEFAVVTRAVEAGVPTPAARWLGQGLLREGAWAYALEWVDGMAIGRKVVAAPGLASAREALPGQLAEALVRIHTVIPSDDERPTDPVGESLERLETQIQGMRERHPALERILGWLDSRRPQVDEVVQGHGDFRTGNFLVGGDGLRAVLDWEFAHWGAREEDIGWLCVRDWRFGALNLPAGGLALRKDFVRAYEAAGGPPIDPVVLHWWEVYGNARWGAGSVFQGERFTQGGETDIELLAIGKRPAEMEWEALRLIRRGPEDWT